MPKRRSTKISPSKLTADPNLTLDAQRAGDKWTLPYNGALSALVVNRLLKDGAKVTLQRGFAPSIQVTAKADAWSKATGGFDIRPRPATTPEKPTTPPIVLRKPRIGIYQAWTANMDEGWTRWVLDHYE